jgi:septal ring factor EnvC (AmiA/AmiB activator)
LAEGVYGDRHLPEGTLDPTSLAVLADALEDAGCDQADLLGHLRGPGPHVRGCWAAEERDLTSAALLTNSPDEQVRLFLQSPVVSAKVKEGLQKAMELRREWGKTQREIAEQQRQLQAITEDQTRLRANLREVPQSSPLHKRYLEKLGKQEDEVEKYRADIQKLQAQEHAQKKALDEFLAAFSAE